MWNLFQNLFKKKKPMKPHICKDGPHGAWNIYYSREKKTLYLWAHDPVRARYWAKSCWELPEYVKFTLCGKNK
jgi:hypothetical protein